MSDNPQSELSILLVTIGRMIASQQSELATEKSRVIAANEKAVHWEGVCARLEVRVRDMKRVRNLTIVVAGQIARATSVEVTKSAETEDGSGMTFKAGSWNFVLNSTGVLTVTNREVQIDLGTDDNGLLARDLLALQALMSQYGSAGAAAKLLPRHIAESLRRTRTPETTLKRRMREYASLLGRTAFKQQPIDDALLAENADYLYPSGPLDVGFGCTPRWETTEALKPSTKSLLDPESYDR